MSHKYVDSISNNISSGPTDKESSHGWLICTIFLYIIEKNLRQPFKTFDFYRTVTVVRSNSQFLIIKKKVNLFHILYVYIWTFLNSGFNLHPMNKNTWVVCLFVCVYIHNNLNTYFLLPSICLYLFSFWWSITIIHFKNEDYT